VKSIMTSMVNATETALANMPRIVRALTVVLLIAVSRDAQAQRRSTRAPTVAPTGAPTGARAAPFAPAAAQDRAALTRYCDHIDSVSAPTRDGISERTDCWKRIQLEGFGSALVEERYQAAVRDFDRAVAADSLRRSMALREAQVEQTLVTVQRAIASRELTAAETTVTDVLRLQPQNERALAFRERIVALRRAQQLRTAVYVASVLVVLAGLGIAFSALVVGVRQSRAAEQDRARAAQRKAMIKIIDGVGRGKMYTLDGPLFRVGSALSERAEEKNDLVLSDDRAFISRYHCVVLRKDGGYFLIDSSLNGTYVNEALLERGDPVRLEDGDELSVAGVARLKFLLV